MTQNAKAIWMVMLMVTLSVPAAWGQSQRVDPVGPAAPIGEDEESSSKRLDEPVKDAPKPDDRPLGGAETFSLGKLTEGRKFVRYSFDASQRLNTSSGAGSTDFHGFTHLGGRIELRRSLPTSDLAVEYEGVGLISTQNSSANSSIHMLTARQAWQRGRWGFMLGNQLTYAPDSPYSLVSAGHFINVVFNFNGESVISPIFIPGQGIVSGTTTRFGNASVAQVRYLLGHRTSVFATGGYGFLNFSSPDFTDFTQRNGVVGFEHSLNGADSLGVNYGFTQYQFSQGGSVVKTHTVRLAYGRRLTNRLAMQIDGGPQIGQFNDPVLGPTRRLFWTASGMVQYRRGRSTYGLGYRHDLNGGSGVLAGAEGDQATFFWQRRMTPRWDMALSLGYGRSKGLQTFSGSVARPSFETQFGGLRLTRKLASDRSVHFGYYASHQTGSVGCGSSCGFALRHSVELGFSWSPRPLRID